jgi:hypothetical protein
VLIILQWPVTTVSQTFLWQGQVSAWVSGNCDKSVLSQGGMRYIPELIIERDLNNRYTVEVDVSLNMYGLGYVHDGQLTDSHFKLKPYRLWGRFATNRFETRLGMQKISFGPAMLIRPLMWYDRIDPRDPLQLTDGVYALLSRYYLQNNTNIWGWLLYGNEDTKGWEMAATKKKSVEYGGRIQLPAFTGEMGITYHNRLVDFSHTNTDRVNPALTEQSVSENRLGFDGKWDAGIGLWFEGAIIYQNSDQLAFKYRRLFTFGTDYTFALGNGLHVVGEYFNAEFAENISGSGEGSDFSGVLLSYPFGLFDMLSTILFYDWKNREFYRTLTWQRTYDNWQINFIGFWNPETMNLYQNREKETSFAGKGFYIMVVFNH